MSTNNTPSVQERYLSVIRDMIMHENNLCNNRLNWMITFQGLLFTAVGFLLKDGLKQTSSLYLTIIILCIVGFVSCLCLGATLSQGNKAVEKLNFYGKLYREAADTDFPPLSMKIGYPPHMGLDSYNSEETEIEKKFTEESKALMEKSRKLKYKKLFFAHNTLPWIMGIAWFVLLVFFVINFVMFMI